MNANTSSMNVGTVGWWQPVLFAGMAGGLGWGIRGQYGHETGAMIAGVLVSLTLVFLLARGISTLQAVRAAALGAVAMGIGGSETYGVTLGLTHNPEMIGNWSSLRWGLLGCLIKGSLWIGFAGLFLGIGLGGKRYRPMELLLLAFWMLVLSFLGSWLFNSPFDIEGRRLPVLHFSNFWHWIPESDVRPRREAWGGLLFALAAAFVYVTWRKKDVMARNMALWGLLGGALGFPLGQSVQAFRQWNPDLFTGALWSRLDPHMNWWNNMETTFGFIMGAVLGLGLWLNRQRISDVPERDDVPLSSAVELQLLGLHVFLLVQASFFGGMFGVLYGAGLVLVILPFACIVQGRIWPWLQVTAVTLLPITAKTVLELAAKEQAIALLPGWTLYFILPLAVAGGLGGWYAWKAYSAGATAGFLTYAVLANVWLYFGLNFAFFRYPWPWSDWTGRTPNAIVFAVFALGLTGMVYLNQKREIPEKQD